MTAVDFAYHRPRTTEEAVQTLAELAPEAVLLAGGVSLAILLNERAARPEHVIDLNEINELHGIRLEGDRVWIGAMTRMVDVETSELLQELVPLLPECARTVADPSLRNRVTVGGGLAYADASGSLPTALLALDAVVVAEGPHNLRVIPLTEFFVAGHETALAPDELITRVEVPHPEGGGSAWLDLDRRHLAYSIVSAAAVVAVEAGSVAWARVAMAGISPTPRRLPSVEQALAGAPTDPESIQAAAALATADADPFGDLHASADYRRRMAAEYAARAVLAAIERAGERS